MHIDQFEMEHTQSIHWHDVEYDLSDSGVTPVIDSPPWIRTTCRAGRLAGITLRGLISSASSFRMSFPFSGARLVSA